MEYRMEKSLTVEAMQSSTIVNFVTLGSTGWYTGSVKMSCRQSAILLCCVQKCIFWCVSYGLPTIAEWSLCSVYWSRYQRKLGRYV